MSPSLLSLSSLSLFSLSSLSLPHPQPESLMSRADIVDYKEEKINPVGFNAACCGHRSDAFGFVSADQIHNAGTVFFFFFFFKFYSFFVCFWF